MVQACCCLAACCLLLLLVLLLLLPGLSPDEAHTREENWGGVLQEVAMSGCGGTPDFLRQAVEYANNRCWGTLAAR